MSSQPQGSEVPPDVDATSASGLITTRSAPPGPEPKHETITVIAPNGARREERLRPNQKVRVVLADAVRAFAKDGLLDPNVEYLLVKGVTPLDANLQLDEAGVVAGDELKIRSKAIPDDGAACTRR